LGYGLAILVVSWNQLALVCQLAILGVMDEKLSREDVASLGGKARARKLSKRRRSEIARQGGIARHTCSACGGRLERLKLADTGRYIEMACPACGPEKEGG